LFSGFNILNSSAQTPAYHGLTTKLGKCLKRKQGHINKQRKQKYGKITGSSKRNAKDKSGKPNGPTSTINNGGTREQQSEAVLKDSVWYTIMPRCF
jgi:hypothetical protein